MKAFVCVCVMIGVILVMCTKIPSQRSSVAAAAAASQAAGETSSVGSADACMRLFSALPSQPCLDSGRCRSNETKTTKKLDRVRSQCPRVCARARARPLLCGVSTRPARRPIHGSGSVTGPRHRGLFPPRGWRSKGEDKRDTHKKHGLYHRFEDKPPMDAERRMESAPCGWSGGGSLKVS